MKLISTVALTCVLFGICRADEISKSRIPQKQLCPKKNEVYEICPKKCPFRTCGVNDNLLDCTAEPNPGDKNCPPPKCKCAPQFFRDDKGDCVPWEDCPKCLRPNEVYDACFSPCGLDRCNFDPTIVRCIMQPSLGDPGCVSGCRCAEGFLRNDDGVCVARDECPCDGDPNAQSGCGGFCQRCSNYNSEFTVACKYPCRFGGCDCREGYIYDENIKKCVLPENCTPTCKKANEVYSECANGFCGYRNCAELGGPELCIDPPASGCAGDCVCANGYLRDDNGNCVLEKECPCRGDPNAQSGCGGFCQRCSNYNLGPVPCDLPCEIGACDCRPGYIYDDVTLKCVLPENCSCKK